MRVITTTSGARLELDGDVLAMIESVSRELARRKELEYGFEEVDREFEHLVAQLTPDELRSVLGRRRCRTEVRYRVRATLER